METQNILASASLGEPTEYAVEVSLLSTIIISVYAVLADEDMQLSMLGYVMISMRDLLQSPQNSLGIHQLERSFSSHNEGIGISGKILLKAIVHIRQASLNELDA